MRFLGGPFGPLFFACTTVRRTETLGKQLLDLKEACDQGVITEKEYKNTRKEILGQG
jgi:hypothetical protein